MKFYIIIILIASIGVSGQELLSKVQNQFNLMQSFSCNFSQEINSAGLSQNVISDGKFIFAKTDNYKIEFNKKLIVSDGTDYWNYDEVAKRVVVSRLEDNPLNFSLNKLIFEYPKECEIIEERNKIKLIPQSDELGLDYITISFDENYLLNKIELVDFNANIYIFRLSNIISSSKIDKELFVFIPPKGVKVIDLR